MNKSQKLYREEIVCFSARKGNSFNDLEDIYFHEWEGRLYKQTTKQWMELVEIKGADLVYMHSGNKLILWDVCLGYFNICIQCPWLGSSQYSREHCSTRHCLRASELLCWHKIKFRIVQKLRL